MFSGCKKESFGGRNLPEQANLLILTTNIPFNLPGHCQPLGAEGECTRRDGCKDHQSRIPGNKNVVQSTIWSIYHLGSAI